MQNNTPTQAQDRVYAGFFVRLAAYLIDWLIVGAALLVVRIPMWIASLAGGADFMFQDFIFTYSAYDILIYVLKVGYFVIMTYLTGATVGKRLLQIKVVSTEDRKPTFFEIAFRESIGKFLSGLVLYVGYFIIGADKDKKGLHDILSDTRVIYYHKKTIVIPPPVEYRTIRFGQMPNQNFTAGQNQSDQYRSNPNGYQQMDLTQVQGDGDKENPFVAVPGSQSKEIMPNNAVVQGQPMTTQDTPDQDWSAMPGDVPIQSQSTTEQDAPDQDWSAMPGDVSIQSQSTTEQDAPDQVQSAMASDASVQNPTNSKQNSDEYETKTGILRDDFWD